MKDDIISILGIVIAAAALVSNAVASRRKKALEAAQSAAKQTSGPMQTMNPQAESRSDEPFFATSGQTEFYTSVEGESSDHKIISNEPQEVEASDESATNEQTSVLNEDFDLRKAVIYSEILKPKFDE